MFLLLFNGGDGVGSEVGGVVRGGDSIFQVTEGYIDQCLLGRSVSFEVQIEMGFR